MTTKATSRSERSSFPITQVIGEVEVSEFGTEPPPVSAMRIICNNDQEGTFVFDDGIYVTSVQMKRSYG
jgi:hypothetical protein